MKKKNNNNFWDQKFPEDSPAKVSGDSDTKGSLQKTGGRERSRAASKELLCDNRRLCAKNKRLCSQAESRSPTCMLLKLGIQINAESNLIEGNATNVQTHACMINNDKKTAMKRSKSQTSQAMWSEHALSTPNVGGVTEIPICSATGSFCVCVCVCVCV